MTNAFRFLRDDNLNQIMGKGFHRRQATGIAGDWYPWPLWADLPAGDVLFKASPAPLHNAIKFCLNANMPRVNTEVYEGRILTGETILSPPQKGIIMENIVERKISESKWPMDHKQPGLTEEENKVLCLLASGVSRKDIEDELSMSPEIMRTFIFNIYIKIGAKNVDKVLHAALRSIKKL